MFYIIYSSELRILNFRIDNIVLVWATQNVLKGLLQPVGCIVGFACSDLLKNHLDKNNQI